MCFDTSSNTGRLTGACIVLEQILGRDLFHLACQHHIMEVHIIAAAAFTEYMGSSSGPKIQLFKRFKSQRNIIDKTDYKDTFTDVYAKAYGFDFINQ